MNKTILLFIIAFLTYCTNHSQNTNSSENTSIETSDFKSFVESLDYIKVPLKYNPQGNLPDLSIDFNKDGFEKYKHSWASRPLGILYKDSKSVGLIHCSIGDWGLTPLLVTYDTNGNKIDSTSFFNKTGTDMAYEAIEYLTFSNGRTIEVIDTVKTWDFDYEKSDVIEESLKVSTGLTIYKVLETGEIKKQVTQR